MQLSLARPGMLVLLAVGLAGCATTKTLHTETSTAAIRSAEELDAPSVPKASLHLQLAKESLEAATALHAEGKREQAESLLLRAEADAELAIALSRAESEKTEALAAMARVRKLQSENPYAPGGAQ